MTVRAVEKHASIRSRNPEREDAHILLSGSVAWTCVDARQRRRKLLKLIPPGMLPMLPGGNRQIDPDLRYLAFTNCKVGQVELEAFFRITLGQQASAYERLLDIQLRHWTALLPRWSKSVVGLGTRGRLQLALLELCADFGIPDSRGLLLSVSPGHDDLADLIGASRSKVTQALGDLERRGMIVRLGRRMAVRPDRIESALRDLPTSLYGRRSQRAASPKGNAPSGE
jgi:hypothetical protein